MFTNTLKMLVVLYFTTHFNPYATAQHGEPLGLVTVTKVLLAHKLMAHEQAHKLLHKLLP